MSISGNPATHCAGFSQRTPLLRDDIPGLIRKGMRLGFQNDLHTFADGQLDILIKEAGCIFLGQAPSILIVPETFFGNNNEFLSLFLITNRPLHPVDDTRFAESFKPVDMKHDPRHLIFDFHPLRHHDFLG